MLKNFEEKNFHIIEKMFALIYKLNKISQNTSSFFKNFYFSFMKINLNSGKNFFILLNYFLQGKNELMVINIQKYFRTSFQ